MTKKYNLTGSGFEQIQNEAQKIERLLRLPQIIGDKKRGIEPLIPVARSTWWLWVADGRAPPAIKLSERVTVWRKSDIDAMVERLCEAA